MSVTPEPAAAFGTLGEIVVVPEGSKGSPSCPPGPRPCTAALSLWPQPCAHPWSTPCRSAYRPSSHRAGRRAARRAFLHEATTPFTRASLMSQRAYLTDDGTCAILSTIRLKSTGLGTFPHVHPAPPDAHPHGGHHERPTHPHESSAGHNHPPGTPMPWAKNKPRSPVYATREYRQAKQQATKAYRQGDPCWHCGRPMYTDKPSTLHLEHRGSPQTRDFVALGLSDPMCNLRDGSRKGRARQNVQVSSLRW